MKMSKQKKIVKDFLKKYSMYHADIDFEEHCNIFMDDMNKGLCGEPASLQMLPTYVTIDKDIPIEEPIIVLDAGGTNFRVATCYFDRNRKPVIENYETYPMPGTKGQISREEFFKTMANYIEPVLHCSKKIGFCFSYAMETLPSKDGRLIGFSKEVKVRDLINTAIGKSLLKTIGDMGWDSDKEIVLLNDTVAALLGGKVTYPDRVFESFIGFILGTGTNTCYIEQNSNIKKVGTLAQKSGTTIINIESGDYGKAPRGDIDLEFDRQTVNPGSYTFEKMISGRYQGGLITLTIEKAAEEGLFSNIFVENTRKIGKVTAKDINDFILYPYSKSKLSTCCDQTTDDAIVLYHLIDEIIERAAKLVAINLSAILLHTGMGKNPCKPVCITAEGSTFYKSKLFRHKLDYYIKSYLNDKKGVYCEFVKAENAPLIGAAVAGLLN